MDTTWLLCSTIVGMVSFSTDWNKDYGDALKAARHTNRPLVVILENPGQPELRSQVLAKAEPQLLRAFEVCRIDVTTEYGCKLAGLYGATELPYTVITDAQCRHILFRGAGHFSPEMWNLTLASHAIQQPLGRTLEAAGVDHASGSLSAASSAPFAHQTLTAAENVARANRRPLLVYATMDNCHFCTKMKSETLSDMRLLEHIAQGFESVVVSREERAEWLAGHGVEIFPATLLLSPDGRLLDRVDGYVTAADLAARMRSAAASLLSRN